jgi:hypothetical protein
MSLTTTIESYKQSKYLFEIIDNVFNDFEEGRVPDVKMDMIINKTINDIHRLVNSLNKINMQDLEGKYSKEQIEITEENINHYYEAADYIEKYLLAKRYYDLLVIGIKDYLDKIDIPEGEYSRIADNYNELAIKFAETLVHPGIIMQYLNSIKRISTEAMSTKEFKKIFDVLKKKMQKKATGQFESFKEYKESLL